jgi:hypothetical protein
LEKSEILKNTLLKLANLEKEFQKDEAKAYK